MSDRLVPDVSVGTIPDTLQRSMPSYTYRLDYGGDGQIRGYTDGIEAVKQAIYKIINTERYEYIIYSWNYGIELADLFGEPIPYVYAELQRRIQEALLYDDRITDVYDFTFSNDGGDVFAEFSVDTIYGTINNVRKELVNVV